MADLPEDRVNEARKLVREIQEKLEELTKALRPARGGGGAREQGGGGS
jgi:hypothetical protein